MNPGPRLAIRADASHQGGIGHIMRTLAIAQEWIARGGRCFYLTCDIQKGLKKRLIEEGCEMIDLGKVEDLSATGQALTEIRPHWLLIDSYHLGSSYQADLQIPERTGLAVISDFGPRDWHQPDCIIHSNLVPISGEFDIPVQARLLSGLPYILIRKELKRASTQTEPSRLAKKILISMGGSDPLEAAHFIVWNLDLSEASCRVILGPAYPVDGKLRELDHPSVELFDCPTSLAPHYAWADTGITTPSTTSLEMAHHGLPIGLVTIADNQHHIREAFIKLQAAIPLADLTSSKKTVDSDSLARLLSSPEARTQLATTSAELLDGYGSSRICKSLGLPEINFATATIDDAKILWEWTNDPVTRQQSFTTKPIPWEDHLKWLSGSLENPQRTLWIVRDESGDPLGQLRFDQQEDDDDLISFSVAPQARGLGLAPLIVDRACQVYREKFPDKSITAWIKKSNRASLRTFHLAKFLEEPNQPESDRVKLRR